ncbi:ABC transporter permease [candidate division KSB1 bacterium]
MAKDSRILFRFIKYVLKKISNPGEEFSLIGDIEEEYNYVYSSKGAVRAKLWLYKQVCISILPRLIFSILWSVVMIKNYVTSSFRNFKRQKVNSIVNIIGLSIALGCFIIVFLYISHEVSYDKFHKDSKSIYAVVSTFYRFNASVMGTPAPAGASLKEYFPQVKKYLRLNESSRLNALVRYKDNVFYESPLFTDEDFFSFFSFKIINGNPESVLQDVNSAVLTRSTAQKYFGDENPLGKTLSLTFGSRQMDFIVSGLSEDNPDNSSIKYGILLNIRNIDIINGAGSLSRWIPFNCRTFVLLDKRDDAREIEKDFPLFITQYLEKNLEEMFESHRRGGLLGPNGEVLSMSLLNIEDVHFSPEIRGLSGTNDVQSSIVLACIGLAILIVACINYTNLHISESSSRVVEIGIRKILGSGKRQMLIQFLSESYIFIIISMIIGIFLSSVFLPVFNQLMNKQLSINDLFNLGHILVIILMVTVTGILSGSYPALIMSGLKPVDILTGKPRLGGRNIFTRLLVVAQFSLSIILLISTLIMGKQIKHMKNKDIGFNREGQVLINSYEENNLHSEKVVDRFREKLIHDPSILNVSGCRSSFDRNIWFSAPHNINGNRVIVTMSRIYYDYINTMGLELTAGRDFSKNFLSDTASAIVNQKFINDMDIKEPYIGETVRINATGNPLFKIIGIVKDFNYMAVNHEISPLLLYIKPSAPLTYLLVKYSGNDIQRTLGILERTYKEIQPGKPFYYYFIDEEIERSYSNFKRWNEIVDYSSILALLVTCVGIFCLTSLIFNRRIKEIGIRKVLGADMLNIFSLLVREFLILVLTAILISWPIAWLVMNKWLQEFQYRINMPLLIFVGSGILALIIVVLTISVQALKAASSDPVDSLKYE